MIMPPSMTNKEAYEVLGLTSAATEAQVKSAYKKLALQTHPDKNPNDPNASKNFHRLSEAYKRITDPASFHDEDNEGEDINEEEMASMFNMMFANMFGGGGMTMNDIFDGAFEDDDYDDDDDCSDTDGMDMVHMMEMMMNDGGNDDEEENEEMLQFLKKMKVGMPSDARHMAAMIAGKKGQNGDLDDSDSGVDSDDELDGVIGEEDMMTMMMQELMSGSIGGIENIAHGASLGGNKGVKDGRNKQPLRASSNKGGGDNINDMIGILSGLGGGKKIGLGGGGVGRGKGKVGNREKNIDDLESMMLAMAMGGMDQADSLKYPGGSGNTISNQKSKETKNRHTKKNSYNDPYKRKSKVDVGDDDEGWETDGSDGSEDLEIPVPSPIKSKTNMSKEIYNETKNIVDSFNGLTNPSDIATKNEGRNGHSILDDNDGKKIATNGNAINDSVFKVGDRVLVNSRHEGEVAFIGEVHYARGLFYGVIVDPIVGKNNGLIKGVEYFKCKHNRGLMLKVTDIEKL